MRLSCPECGCATRVMDSRHNKNNNQTYRKNVCGKCKHTFYSVECAIIDTDDFDKEWDALQTTLKNSYQGPSVARVTCDGETHTYSEWAEITGIPSITIRRRIDRGWAPELALSVPVNKRGKRSDTVKDWYKFCMKRGIK